jgi:glycosyltransferase involved in cell wall biosynthesis
MDSKSPIILIRSKKPSHWDSCISIVNNLELSYRIAFGERIQVFDCPENLPIESLNKEILRLNEEHVQEFIVIDHSPSLTSLIQAITTLWKGSLPQITIHTFGGFTYRGEEFSKIEELFKQVPLKIVGPSPRATRFIMNHFAQASGLFHTVSFPISKNDFSFNVEARKLAKKLFNIDSSTKVITYAGRIASGKNVNLAIELMRAYLEKNEDAVFIIAGSVDHSNVPGFKPDMNLEPEITKRIRYEGKLSQDNLKSLYHASDVFLSLSTYPLEDFGMGPLEALACGCPAILTNWGGYSNLSLSTDHCRLLDVSISRKGLEIDKSRFFQHIDELLKDSENMDMRKSRSEAYLEAFSSENIAEEIKQVHAKPYVMMMGFSPLTRAYKWINEGEKFSTVIKTFYHTLYRSFFE